MRKHHRKKITSAKKFILIFFVSNHLTLSYKGKIDVTTTTQITCPKIQ